jgi:hypothetical protein
MTRFDFQQKGNAMANPSIDMNSGGKAAEPAPVPTTNNDITKNFSQMGQLYSSGLPIKPVLEPVASEPDGDNNTASGSKKDVQNPTAEGPRTKGSQGSVQGQTVTKHKTVGGVIKSGPPPGFGPRGK